MPAPQTAAALLQAWEARAQPTAPAYAAQRPALLAQLTSLCASLAAGHEINLDSEDLRTALLPAHSFGIAQAAATGPDRPRQLVRALLSGPGSPGPALAPGRRGGARRDEHQQPRCA